MKIRNELARMTAIAALATVPVFATTACDGNDDGPGEAFEELKDEAEDAKDEVEDEVDDRF